MKWLLRSDSTAAVRLWGWRDDGSALGKWTNIPTGTDLTPYLVSGGQQRADFLFAELVTPGEAIIEFTTSFGGASFIDEVRLYATGSFSLAVDANRDQTITLESEGPSDATSAAKPYRFWVNSDDDHGAYPGDVGSEHVPAPRPDYSVNLISSQRDLEDYSRLWISLAGLQSMLTAPNANLKIGLKWTDVSSGAPAIKIFPAVEADGGTAYLTDGTANGIAQQQASKYAVIDARYANEDPGMSTHTTIGGSDVFILPQSLLTNLSASQPTLHLLFEGAGIGKGQLKIVILDASNNQIGEGPGVWFDLQDVKSMYERATATPDETYRPYLFSESAPSESYFSFSLDSAVPFIKPTDEAPTALVFVHGWNMSYDEYIGFSEIMFKRLWWQGYKGRFCAFRWATMTSVDSYNTSEFWAWRYGQSLTTYVSDIKSRLSGYAVSVAAHSMGNIVAGSALNRGMTLNRYFLMEAAVPSGCYNDSVNNYLVFAAAEVSKPTPDTTSDLGYRLYLQSAVGSSRVGKILNFYNQIDFALATGNYFSGLVDANWEQNQVKYKPDDPAGIGQYHYDPSQPAGQRAKLTYITGERYITDVNESMAYVARPRSKAIGAEPQSSTVFPTSHDLRVEYDFGDTRPDHSGQFNRTIQQVNGIFQQVTAELK